MYEIKKIRKIKYSVQGRYLPTPKYIQTIYREESKIVYKAKWENMAVEKTIAVPKNKIEKMFSIFEKGQSDRSSILLDYVTDAPEEEMIIHYSDGTSEKEYTISGEFPEFEYKALDVFKKETEEFNKWADVVLLNYKVGE